MSNYNYVLETCIDSVESAISAKKGGATRLELCSNLIIGGTTPHYELLEQVKKETNLETRVLIRPRFGDFCYSEFEVKRMEKQVHKFIDMGADGVVIGALKPNGELDINVLKRLIHMAKGKKITLHRGFDVCKDPYKSLEIAKDIGINTILTSGQEQCALLGINLIKDLISKNTGIEILVGAGVNSTVIEKFLKETNATSFHMSGKKVIPSKMEYKKQNVNMGLKEISEYEIWETDEMEIRKAVEVIERFIKIA